MELPYSEELNIGHLSKLFGKTTNCYKFFWFQAILRKLDGIHNRFTFEELINEMIVDAWYMVTEYHLRLGPIGSKDNLEEIAKYIHENYHIRSTEKRDKLMEFLQTTEDKNIKKYKLDLIRYVPYKLQVPFYDEIHIDHSTWCGSKEKLTNKINSQKRLIYYFALYSGLNTIIEIDALWAAYLLKHKEIIKGWTQLSLIHYLQNKNPSVPGIADKLEHRNTRGDTERVRKYWQLIIQKDPSLTDIYGKIDLKDVSISVDHFIPWQYVAHDELWNLHPTTQSINSSKNNSLPAWELYFEKLGGLEYRAYELKKEHPEVKETFQKIAPYHLNNQEIRNQLYEDGLDRNSFITRLEHVIRPIYEAAQLSGFKEWVYKEKEALNET